MISLSISHYIILYGGIFAWILALGQLMFKNRQRGNYVLAMLLLFLGYSQISSGTYRLDMISDVYHIIKLTSIITFFCVGPLTYLYFSFILEPDFNINSRKLVHFMPSFFTAVIIGVILFTTPPTAFNDYIFHNRFPASTAGAAIYILATLSVAYGVVYALYVISKIYFLIQSLPAERRKILQPGLFLAGFFIINGIAWILYRALRLEIGDVLNAITSIIIIVLYLLGNRYPEYLQILKLEATRVNYERSYLNAIDVEYVMEQLKLLMESEKAFCDEDLSLAKLAREVHVTPHQLSEILNIRLMKNFYTFVNEYRISEAQNMLLVDTKRPVLSIANAVGFETPSAFYSAFKKITGFSPSEFRKTRTNTHRQTS